MRYISSIYRFAEKKGKVVEKYVDLGRGLLG
jgi:hypothetical protein